MIRRSMMAILGLAFITAGCSGSSAAFESFRIGKNLSKKDSYLKIWLDGQEAQQNKLKKGLTGYSKWTIKEPVECTPRLKFMIEDPGRFGRITLVTVSINQEFEADYSHQAEFTIVAKDGQEPNAQMKPDMEYDMGAMGDDFKILNLTGKEVEKVELKPGLKYQLSLSVKADKSETALIEFTTK